MNKSSTHLVMFENTAVSASLYGLLDFLCSMGKPQTMRGNAQQPFNIIWVGKSTFLEFLSNRPYIVHK